MPGPSTATLAPSLHASAVGPTNGAEIEVYGKQLADKDTPMRRKFEIMTELKDSAETQKEYSFYEKYLAVLFPVIVALLGEEEKVVFVKDNMEQVRLYVRLN
jgi:transformation/transcription domain-associated protein